MKREIRHTAYDGGRWVIAFVVVALAFYAIVGVILWL